MAQTRHELLGSQEFVSVSESEDSLEEIRAKLSGHLTHCIDLCLGDVALMVYEPAFRRYLRKVSDARTLRRMGDLADAVSDFLDASGLARGN